MAGLFFLLLNFLTDIVKTFLLTHTQPYIEEEIEQVRLLHLQKFLNSHMFAVK